ncbi:MAG: phosphoribosylanthranilate isomerase [Pseudomonadota bacterium]
MDVDVKFCGLSKPEEVRHAIALGAAYVGFVFFPKSPRNITFETAAELADAARGKTESVALLVNPDDMLIDHVMTVATPDHVQLHGQETPERVLEIRKRSGRPVIKALGVSSATDLERLKHYEAAADQLLLDAKPPEGAALPGGNGHAFDWTILRHHHFATPWLLAGGLHPGNVADAVRISGTSQVDVSSGVETTPGQKSLELMSSFVAALE